jgi:hypothetical protein
MYARHDIAEILLNTNQSINHIYAHCLLVWQNGIKYLTNVVFPVYVWINDTFNVSLIGD